MHPHYYDYLKSYEQRENDDKFISEFEKQLKILKNKKIDINLNFFNIDAKLTWDPIAHIDDYPLFLKKYSPGPRINFVLEGLDGIGKTESLLWLKETILKNYNNSNVLPIYFSFNVSKGFHPTKSISFFDYLCIKLVESMIDQTKSYDENGTAAIGIEKIKRLESACEELKEYLLKDRESERSISKTGKIDMSASLPPISAKASGSASETTRELKKGSTEIYKNPTGYFLKVLKLFVNITNCDYIIFLLDDCYGYSNAIQSEIICLIDAINGSISTHRASKLAYYYGSIHSICPIDKETKGLVEKRFLLDLSEVQIEVMEGLDESEINYINFFKKLTLNRWEMVHKKPFSDDDPVEMIFENEDSFILAAYCSNGIPGRYFKILQKAYDIAFIKEESKLTYEDIDSAVDSLKDGLLSKLDNHEYDLLAEILTKTLNSNKKSTDFQTIYFKITPAEIDSLKSLISKGCLHLKRDSIGKNSMKTPGKIMMIDMALAYSMGIFNKEKAIDIFTNDIKYIKDSQFKGHRAISLKTLQPRY